MDLEITAGFSGIIAESLRKCNGKWGQLAFGSPQLAGGSLQLAVLSKPWAVCSFKSAVRCRLVCYDKNAVKDQDPG